jgi:hypothetical protein
LGVCFGVRFDVWFGGHVAGAILTAKLADINVAGFDAPARLRRQTVDLPPLSAMVCAGVRL